MHLIFICIFFGTHTCLCRLQNWPYFDVCKYAWALTLKVCNGVGNGEWGSRVRLLRHAWQRTRQRTAVCGRLTPDWLFLAIQLHSRNSLGVLGFLITSKLHSLPRSGGKAFTTPRSSTWVDLNCIRFGIVLDTCCISKTLSRVYKEQTGFKLIGVFVFEIWVLRFRDLGASWFGLHFRVLRFLNYPKWK